MKATIGPGRLPQGPEVYSDTDDEYDEHQVKEAADTLTKAESIKADPKLHGHAMKHLASKAAHIKAAMKHKKPGSIQDLRDLASKKSGEDKE